MSTALVVTTINPPNSAMRKLSEGCIQHGWDFIVAGDSKSPTDFNLEGARFLSLGQQRESGFSLGLKCPESSYTRKNIGYLDAIRAGARIIVETDDDNHPKASFWNQRKREVECRSVRGNQWVNAYRYFADSFIYPRGLPLIHAREEPPAPDPPQPGTSPIHQGLADRDPDVDAVYRMLFPDPFYFDTNSDSVLLEAGVWCPFNSQNTTFFEDALPLLYLPAHCSFRMTDIWRSFVAQRILHELGCGVLFHGSTVWQERNEHDLQRDFTEELPGYLHNSEIRKALVDLSLTRCSSPSAKMECCYQELMRRGWVGKEEENLLNAWNHDLKNCGLT